LKISHLYFVCKKIYTNNVQLEILECFRYHHNPKYAIPRIYLFKSIIGKFWGRYFLYILSKLWFLGFIILLGDSIVILLNRLTQKKVRNFSNKICFIPKNDLSKYEKIDDLCSDQFTLVYSNPILDLRRNSYVSYLSISDLLSSFILIFPLYINLINRNKNSIFRNCLFRLFRDVLLLKFIDNLNHKNVEVIFHESHYDSIAFIINTKFKNKVCQIQHGELDPDLKLPFKIKFPSKLFLLNSEGQTIFFQNIFNRCKAFNDVEIIEYRKNMIFEKIAKGTFNVLIASRNSTITGEMEFINSIQNLGLKNIKFYVKWHPSSKFYNRYPKKFLHSNDIMVWNSLITYPDVDLVVGSCSTLINDYMAFQYKSVDIFANDNIKSFCTYYNAKQY